MTNLLISDFTDERFQSAFQLYFAELGLEVQNWDQLWLEMNADTNAQNHAYLRLDEGGSIVGFIQFCVITMDSWFFTETLGFIREFWICREARGHGHGSALLALAEDYFRTQGIRKCILTTDTAPDFYQRHGYQHDANIAAHNKDNVYVKTL